MKKTIKLSQLSESLQKQIKEYMKDISEEGKGLWHNIRAKRARGEKPAKKGSEAYKKAVKAAKEIKKDA